MTAPWRLAKALDKLRTQINALEPTRDKTSDGTIGDAAHAATKSEHNPNKYGVVTGMDITHDPLDGVDCRVLCAALIASRDPRILYVIWNGGMYRSYPKTGTVPWQRKEYTGPNPHDHHLHISLIDDDDGIEALYDDTRPWALPADLSLTQTSTTPIVTLRLGDTGPDVLWLRERLRVHGYTVPTTGDFNGAVKDAVLRFQHWAGLASDGVVGRITAAALAAAPKPAAPIPVPTAAPPPQPAPPPLDPTTILLGGSALGVAAWNFLGWVGAGAVAVVAIALLLLFLRLRRKAK